MSPSGAIAATGCEWRFASAGRPAVTHYRVLERFRAHTYLSVKLETGRTHQIRLHLSHMQVSDRRRPGLRRPLCAAARRDAAVSSTTLRGVQAPGAARRDLGFRSSAHRQAPDFAQSRCRRISRNCCALRDDAQRHAERAAMSVAGSRPTGRRRRGVRALSTLRERRRERRPLCLAQPGRSCRAMRRRPWPRIAGALAAAAGLPAEPAWLSQVHGVEVADLDAAGRCRGRRGCTDHADAVPDGDGVRNSHGGLPARRCWRPNRAIWWRRHMRAGAGWPAG